jgi:hypothetical protein
LRTRAVALDIWVFWPLFWRHTHRGRRMIYNVLLSLYLADLGTVRHLVGLLLWPGVALYAGVALLPAWTWRSTA